MHLSYVHDDASFAAGADVLRRFRQALAASPTLGLHWGFSDPAHATGTPEEIRDEFRRVRDQIRLVFEAYAAGLKEGARSAG